MLVGPFIKEYSSHQSSTTLLTNHNVLSFWSVPSSLHFHNFSYQLLSPCLWNAIVSHGAIHNFHQLLIPLFLMYSIFSPCLWSVQVAKPIICLHAFTGHILCKLLADILRSSGTASLPRELQQETGVGNLSFSLFSWSVGAERKRLFH